MKWFYLFILAIALSTVALQTASTQSPVNSTGPQSTKLTGSVERTGERLYLHLTNDDPIGEFRGSAEIRFGAATPLAVVKLDLALTPGETRLFPLKTSAEPGEQYTLTVFSNTGGLILYQDAPIKQTSRAPRRATSATDQRVKLPGTDEIRVQARFSRSEPTAEAKINSPNDPHPLVLTLDVTVPTPIDGANLAIKVREFKQSKQVSINKSAQVDFKLPEELKEVTLHYTLTDATGRIRASGELDLEQLMQADSIVVSDFNMDKSDYAPGDSARIMIQLQGQAPRGYQMDVTAKEGNTLLYKDTRRGATHNNQSKQQFVIDLPQEPKAPVIFEYSIVGVQTGRLLYSGLREIVVSDQSSKGNSGNGPRISP